VIGADFKLCEKTAQFDAKKYAEVAAQGEQTQARVKKLSHNEGEQQAKAAGGEKKKHEKKPQEAAASPVKKDPKPAKKEKEAEVHEDEAAGGDETDDILAAEPKQKDPFAEMPKTSLNMDEFKRVYSNEDTATKALPYFWEHFDKTNCSIWLCEYKYPEELTKVFMTCNLIAGMFQRLEKLRKNAFGSMCVFGTDNDNTIAGVWFWRGPGLAFELSSDWKTDYESYTWTRLELDSEKTKALVDQFFLWEGEHNGKKFNQGKIFK
jgi:elongation factor 1-gamma